MNELNYLKNGGASGQEIAAVNWAETPLGPPQHWPVSLRTMLSVVLYSKKPQVLMWGPELITFYNDEYRPIMGSLPSGIGRPYPAFRPDIWPAIKEMIEGVRKGESFFFANREMNVRRHGEDETAVFSCSYAPIMGEDGQVAGVLATMVETTEQVRARRLLEEENSRFRDLFRNAPTFLAVVKGPDHVFEFVNEAYLNLIGQRDVIGRRVQDVLPELEQQGFMVLLNRVYATGESHVGLDTRVDLTGADGQSRTVYVNFIYQPIFDVDGEVTGILLDGSDVTEQHLAKQAAEALQVELMQATRISAMVTMASSLAHELNQPLAAAKTYLSGASILLRGQDGADPDLLEAIGTAADQISRAGEIIRRLRSMVSQRTARPKPIDIRGCIDNALRLVGTSGTCEGVPIHRRIKDGPLVAAADDVQIEQVLINMIKNACAQMDGITDKQITLTARANKRKVTVEIADNGPGISDEMASGYFDVARRDLSDGMGLGLSICRTMIEAMDGTFYARNGKVRGAVFGFTLPSGA